MTRDRAAPAAAGPDPDLDPPLLRGEALAGRVVQGVAVAAGLWVVGTGALASVLGALGWWRPWLGWPLVAALAGGSWLVARRVPARPMPLWSAGALVTVALASGVWLAATHSEQVLPRRDSASYLQGAISLADTGRRVVPVDAATTGGADRPDGIVLSSPAFYEVGTRADPAIQPQFPVGSAAVWSLGTWAGGIPLVLLLPALATAIGLLGLGVLTGATVGVRWAPLGALAAALTFPLVHTGRSTYSEPLALVTLGAGLIALTVAAGRSLDPPAARRAAVVAGLLVGGTAFVRVDGLRETILLVPVAGLYAVARRAWLRPLLVAAAGSTVLALASALGLSYRYLGDIGASLLGLVALGVGGCVVVALLVLAGRRGWLSRGPLGGGIACLVATLPVVVPVLVVLTGIGLALRPLWLTSRQQTPNGLLQRLQLEQGLPIDGHRTYDERTVQWLSWWVGPIALAIALVALAVLLRRVAQCLVAGQAPPRWTGPLLVGAGSTVLTLGRSGITPDHPWAERRLVIAVVLVAVLGVAATAWVLRRLHRRVPVAVAVLAAVATAGAVLVPTALATWPHAGERVEAGELAAVERVCRALRPRDVVLMTDSRAANEWPQVLRGQCGVAAVSTTRALRESPALGGAVGELGRRVAAGGGRLVLLSADSPDPLSALGARPVAAVDVMVLEDDRLLLRRPDHLVTLGIHVWLAPAGRP